MCKDMPNESSVYAREGSAAHAIGEMCLRSGKDAADYIGHILEEYPETAINETLCASVQEYLDTVRWEVEKYEIAGYDDAELGIEIRFDLTHIYPDMFGTCDAVVFLPAWKKLVVFDYKHGWVSVPVERNPQTMYYALGAVTGKHNREVDTIELVIVQPRSGHRTAVKRWSCGYEELLDFKYVLIDSAKRTEGAQSRLNPGEWCKFCPAAPVCRALKEKVEEIVMAKSDPVEGITLADPDKIPFDKLKSVWENALIIESWIKNVKAYVHKQALEGNKLPGTKFVEGRSNRDWIDEDEAKEALRTLMSKKEIPIIEMMNNELKSPKQIEDAIGKKFKDKIANLWRKNRGALILVPESDEREEAKADALKEFA